MSNETAKMLRQYPRPWLTFPGEESGQELAQAVPGVSAILGWVVVGELA